MIAWAVFNFLCPPKNAQQNFANAPRALLDALALFWGIFGVSLM